MFIYIPCQHNFVQVAGYILIDILQFIFYICVMVNFRTFYFKVYESNSLSEMQAIYRVMGRFTLGSWILLSVSCLPWLTWPRESCWLIKHSHFTEHNLSFISNRNCTQIVFPYAEDSECIAGR